jgi:ribonuclease BN (tRNA processing enzyme)
MQRINPSIDVARLEQFRRHLLDQHLAPDQVGLLASHAHVKKVVLVHNDLSAVGAAQAIATIDQMYHGPVIEAHDLDRF